MYILRLLAVIACSVAAHTAAALEFRNVMFCYERSDAEHVVNYLKLGEHRGDAQFNTLALIRNQDGEPLCRTLTHVHVTLALDTKSSVRIIPATFTKGEQTHTGFVIIDWLRKQEDT